MTRNIDYRVEVICPVKDADAQRTLQDILDQQWNDNCKARVIDAYQSNNMVTSEGKATLVRSQETIHRYLETQAAAYAKVIHAQAVDTAAAR